MIDNVNKKNLTKKIKTLEGKLKNLSPTESTGQKGSKLRATLDALKSDKAAGKTSASGKPINKGRRI